MLSRLFEAKAWEGVGNLAVSEEQTELLEALRSLEEAGLMRRAAAQEGVQQQWHLRDEARVALQSGACLSNCQPALQIRPDQPLHSMTTWELVQSLLQDGFVQDTFSQNVEPFHVPRNAPNKFYCVGSRWCKAYLQVLVCRKQLPCSSILVL